MAAQIGVPGVGPEVTVGLIDFFHEMHNVDVWEDLMDQVSPADYIVETKGARWRARPSSSPASWKP
jgi:DNA ligase (NAD+)